MKDLFKDYYNKPLNKINKENYPGIEFVAYDKEYDKKNDEIDLIEKHFNININVYTHDEPELLQIDRRSITTVSYTHLTLPTTPYV